MSSNNKFTLSTVALAVALATMSQSSLAQWGDLQYTKPIEASGGVYAIEEGRLYGDVTKQMEILGGVELRTNGVIDTALSLNVSGQARLFLDSKIENITNVSVESLISNGSIAVDELHVTAKADLRDGSDTNVDNLNHWRNGEIKGKWHVNCFYIRDF